MDLCIAIVLSNLIALTRSEALEVLFEIETASKQEDCKPVKGRQGRLTKTAIGKMRRPYEKAICNDVNIHINSVKERDAIVHTMQTGMDKPWPV